MPHIDLIHQDLTLSNLTRVQTSLCIINKGIFDITQPVFPCPMLFFWAIWDVEGLWTFIILGFFSDILVLRWLKKNVIV